MLEKMFLLCDCEDLEKLVPLWDWEGLEKLAFELRESIVASEIDGVESSRDESESKDLPSSTEGEFLFRLKEWLGLIGLKKGCV